MPLDLPPPFEGTLARSPLALVACQLRYGDPTSPLTGSIAAAMRGELREQNFSYARVEQVQVQNINIDVGAGVASREAAGRGWRLVSDDGRWIVTITGEAVTLETTRYGSWDNEFRPRVHALIRVFSQAVGPRIETRLGLRYVDVIVEPLAAALTDWQGWIAGPLLGPIAHEVLGRGVTVAQQQFTVQLDEDLRATIRHGAYPDPARDGASSYLLDTDVFRETLLEYDEAQVTATTERLHDWNLRLFQQMVTPAMLERLRGELGAPA